MASKRKHNDPECINNIQSPKSLRAGLHGIILHFLGQPTLCDRHCPKERIIAVRRDSSNERNAGNRVQVGELRQNDCAARKRTPSTTPQWIMACWICICPDTTPGRTYSLWTLRWQLKTCMYLLIGLWLGIRATSVISCDLHIYRESRKHSFVQQ